MMPVVRSRWCPDGCGKCAYYYKSGKIRFWKCRKCKKSFVKDSMIKCNTIINNHKRSKK